MVIKVTNKDLYDAEEVFSSLNDHTWLTRALERIGLQDGLRRRARSIQKKRLKDHLTLVCTKQRMYLDLVRSILPEGTPEEVVKQRARVTWVIAAMEQAEKEDDFEDFDTSEPTHNWGDSD